MNSAIDSSSSSQIVVDVSRHDHSANFSCIVYNEANQNSPLISTRILNVQCKYLLVLVYWKLLF